MNRPLVWAALFFAGGIFSAAELGLTSWRLPIAAAIAAIAGATLRNRVPHTDRAFAALLFLAAGQGIWVARAVQPVEDALARFAREHPGAQLNLEGVVRESSVVLDATDYTRFLLDVDLIRFQGREIPIEGGVIVRWSQPAGPLFPGDRIALSGTLGHGLGRVNHGSRGLEDNLRRDGIHTETRIRGDAVVRLGRDLFRPMYWAARLRQWQAERLSEAMPEAALPFVLTVWLGERGMLTQETHQDHLKAGTAHILAVSGIHVGIIFISLSEFLRMFVRNPRLRIALVLVGVFTFALVAGARVSSLRAAFMFALYGAAEFFDREPDAPSAVSLAAFILLLGNPGLLYDMGFLLSFGSVASILFFGDHVEGALRRMPYALRYGVTPTLAVQFLPLPLMLHYFHVLPLYAVAANIAVMPLLTIALWLAFGAALAAALFPPLSLILGHALWVPVAMIGGVAGIAANAPGSHLAVVSPTFLAAALYTLAMLALLWSLHARSLRPLAACALLLCAAWLAWRPWQQPPGVDFLDVGHGDAAFVRTPGGDRLLIDGGDRTPFFDEGARVVAPFLLSHQIDRLDYVFVSHPDSDHVGGLFHIIERFPVGKVYLAATVSDRPLEHEFIAHCAAHGVPVARLARGDALQLRGALLETLHPPEGWPEEDSPNDASLVFRLSWPGFSILFPGDAEARAETALLDAAPAALFLKTPHHGSPTSSSEPFLDAVAPRHAFVSTRASAFREAVAPEIIERYAERGIRLWRTDVHGGIRLRHIGETFVIETARGARGLPPGAALPAANEPLAPAAP